MAEIKIKVRNRLDDRKKELLIRRLEKISFVLKAEYLIVFKAFSISYHSEEGNETRIVNAISKMGYTPEVI